MSRTSLIAERQAHLRFFYGKIPGAARIVKSVRTGPRDGRDPFHGVVVPENRAQPGAPYGVAWHYGIDRAVGGQHDAPNPAEMLCGALAACADGTVRMVANLLGVELEELDVEVSGHLDVRGALDLDRSVRVGFERLGMAIRLRAAPGTPPGRAELLGAAAEQFCVVLDTLRGGVPVDVSVAVAPAEGDSEGARAGKSRQDGER